MRARALGAAGGALLALLAGCDRSDLRSPAQTLTSTAGTVEVQCVGHSKIVILGSHPYGGYTAETIVRGPTYQASLRFSSPTANDFKVFLHCTDGEPYLDELEVEDSTLNRA